MTVQQSHPFSHEKLLVVLRDVVARSNGREDDDHPLPPGPWDPVIRRAWERVTPFGPGPEPWLSSSDLLALIWTLILRDYPALYDAHIPNSLSERARLNPQPLPPRQAFLESLTRTIVDRAELMQEIADSAGGQGEQRAIIIVSGYLGRFVDDFCATGFKLRWPFRGPPPHWFVKELDGVDFLQIAAGFDDAAKEAFSPAMRQVLKEASFKFADAGLSRIQ